MKRKHSLSLLLIFAALFTNIFAQAQSEPINRPQMLHDELMNAGFKAFNSNDGQMDFEKFFPPNTENRQNIPNRIFRNNPLKSLKNSDELVYDSDSIFSYKTSGNFLREFTSRDASGKPLTDITQEWFPEINQWVNSSKLTISYDASGNLTTIILQTWSDGNTIWVDYEKADYTYDASGNILSGINQLWDEVSGVWLNSFKFIMVYDGFGNFVSEVSLNWDNGIDDWINKNRRDITYNASGNESSQVSQYWETATNTWINSNKINVTYDVSENLLNYIIEYWDIAESTWVKSTQGIYTYYATGNMATVTSQYWDVASSVWVNVSYMAFTYDASGNMLSKVRQLWKTETSSWGDYESFGYTWDNSNNMLSAIVQSWDTGNNNWLNDSKYEFQYDYDNEKVLATYYDWYDAWVPADGYITVILFGNNLYWGYEVHKIEFYYSSYTLGIEDNPSQGNHAFEVYPNPTGNTVNIKFTTSSPESGNITIYDAFGKLVKEIPTGNIFPGEYVFPVDVSSLEAGIYMIKWSGGRFYQTQKLMIAK
jgi:hypothetical protein